MVSTSIMPCILSIPAWFDWRMPDSSPDLKTFWLSIPAWFDWRSTARWWRFLLSGLSIPAWFDWRGLVVGKECNFVEPFNPSLVRLAHAPEVEGVGGVCSFNPSLVRLAPVPPPRGPHHASHFQSQLGSIGAFVAARLPAPGSYLSIPAWFDWRDGGGTSNPYRHCLSIPAWFDWRVSS